MRRVSKDSMESRRPWETADMSRATWFRRRAQARAELREGLESELRVEVLAELLEEAKARAGETPGQVKERRKRDARAKRKGRR